MTLQVQQGLWLPDGQTPGEAAAFRCRVPVGDGKVCGRPFRREERVAMEHHVRQCLSDHHDAIVAERERQHPSIMKAWDEERFRWVRENGAAILEGRVKM